MFSAIVESPGEIVICDRFAASTVTVAVPVTDSLVALTVMLLATFLAVARPLGVIESALLEEDQVTDPVMSWVVWSSNVPTAVNCCNVPSGILGELGVTAIDTRVAPDTVSVIWPEMLPEVALMVVGPAATAVARPCVPGELLMVAAPVAEELQVTEVVKLRELLSLKCPIAVNCSEVPGAMEE